MATSKSYESIKHLEDPSYPSHLSSGLNKLRQQASFCDVTIIVGGQRFSAHKAILTCACDYFQGMFSPGFQESAMSEITIPGSPESFTKLLEFAYTGHLTLSLSTVTGVLKMASYMVFTQAVKLCAAYLNDITSLLSMDDSFEVWSIGSQHDSLSTVAKLCHAHLINNYPKLCESEVFLENATADFLLESLGDDGIETDTYSEEQVGLMPRFRKWYKVMNFSNT